MANCSLTKQQIFGSIRKSQQQLLSLGIKSIGLFGSFARGDASDQSDVDILVEFDADKHTYDNFIDTCLLLEKLFDRRVEVVTSDALSPYIRPYILKEVEYVTLAS